MLERETERWREKGKEIKGMRQGGIKETDGGRRERNVRV